MVGLSIHLTLIKFDGHRFATAVSKMSEASFNNFGKEKQEEKRIEMLSDVEVYVTTGALLFHFMGVIFLGLVG